MTFKTQVALGLLLAIVLGYLFQGSASSIIPNQDTLRLTPQPFTTLPGAWMVQVTINQTEAPVITLIEFLEQGRITVMEQGENHIRIVDGRDGILYEQPFQVSYMIGEPLQYVESREILIVVPHIERAVFIEVETPQGRDRYELPSN